MILIYFWEPFQKKNLEETSVQIIFQCVYGTYLFLFGFKVDYEGLFLIRWDFHTLFWN